MKLACNCYPEVLELIREDKITLDYLKLPALGYQMKAFEKPLSAGYEPLMAQLNPIRPVLIHGLGMTYASLGSRNFTREFDAVTAKRIIELSGVNGVSVHLTGIDPSKTRKESKDILVSNIRCLKEQFPAADFISFENIHGSLSNREKLGVCMEADFISDIINETDSDFLLDISHAYSSAKALGISFNDYLHELPLDRIYEIHMNGWFENETSIMAHVKIHEQGYQILEEVLKKYPPKILTLEYGRDTDWMGRNIPLMSPDRTNETAKEDIREQLEAINEIGKRLGLIM